MRLYRRLIAELGLTGRDGRLSHTKSVLWVILWITASQHTLSLGVATLLIAASYGLKGLALFAPYFNTSSNQESTLNAS